ncbi:MAG: aspartyl-phosphate phosphatase Spo0E family protein [Thermoanaerobacter sp.]|nr:aspartyl-phosphate phosphatase Spo0E family protein [Thermoanaerobacter sp.]
MLELGKVILQLEKARRKMLATDQNDKEKLLAASRKVDELVLEYYRAKLSENREVKSHTDPNS